RKEREAGHPHLEPPLDDHPGDDRAHDRGTRRPQARPDLHHRVDGRSQARRVRSHPHLSRPRRPQRAGCEARMRVRAHARYIRMSPYKVRQVLGLIRGLPVQEADQLLSFTNRAAAEPVRKVLRSAVANAEHNHALDADELIVAEAYADEGPTLRRWRPRARGRATRIRKRTSHITVVVAERSDLDARRPAKEVS